MCGRFVASRRVEEIADILDVDDLDLPPEQIGPRWNVAPEAEVLALTYRIPKPTPSVSSASEGAAEGEAEAASADSAEPATARRRLQLYRWGLVPSWAKDPSTGNRMFNARAESLAEKPAFRNALARRRCLIPADAFYEWEKVSGGGSGRRRPRRQPWVYEDPKGDLLTFAGLWEAWRPRRPDPATGEPYPWLLSCTIITTEANEVVAPVHDRMPVIIEPDDRAAWLALDGLEESGVHALLRPSPTDALVAYRVSPEVNDSESDGPQLIEPFDPDAPGTDEEKWGSQQGQLFDSL